MLRVTQGHEKSISVEVFIKSFLLLSKNQQKQIIYYVNTDVLSETCKHLGISLIKINSRELIIGNCLLQIQNIEKNKKTPLTTIALDLAVCAMKSTDILLTMPSSKDQIFYKNDKCSGHTDYFRKLYDDSKISMLFKNKWENVLLLSDHIPLKEVSNYLSTDLITDKISTTLSSFEKHFYKIEKVVLAGINPHAGENGLLGTDEIEKYNEAVQRLKTKFSNIEIVGPLAADSLHNFHSNRILKVFAYHDQGLTYFKSKYNYIGANITLGLPFIRLSVDHGTAFDLYLKNKANYMGCYTLIDELLD